MEGNNWKALEKGTDEKGLPIIGTVWVETESEELVKVRGIVPPENGKDLEFTDVFFESDMYEDILFEDELCGTSVLDFVEHYKFLGRCYNDFEVEFKVGDEVIVAHKVNGNYRPDVYKTTIKDIVKINETVEYHLSDNTVVIDADRMYKLPK